ncbi:HPr family phosphocarrier protein [Pseudoflavonifractor phocaeensis]|uniref:HPr family phosphocarrier protein n=1 Tax=Pseudoflavonifractor phocaeensis TaxID=1870988 RepID=UPI00195C57A7|nr:HPr family phosphocarrier protein [Pseudoflavonifractor phocaeensis]MBM6926592.1 HPr family phosphocarrier protein [Pseudoflavonifractor phocaeensis]
MVSAITKVINPQGIHMRPAQLFVDTMAQYPCDVTILCNDAVINGKSIMHLMAAPIRQGSELEIRCSGPRETEALKAAVELIESGLGE